MCSPLRWMRGPLIRVNTHLLWPFSMWHFFEQVACSCSVVHLRDRQPEAYPPSQHPTAGQLDRGGAGQGRVWRWATTTSLVSGSSKSYHATFFLHLDQEAHSTWCDELSTRLHCPDGVSHLCRSRGRGKTSAEVVGEGRVVIRASTFDASLHAPDDVHTCMCMRALDCPNVDTPPRPPCWES